MLPHKYHICVLYSNTHLCSWILLPCPRADMTGSLYSDSQVTWYGCDWTWYCVFQRPAWFSFLPSRVLTWNGHSLFGVPVSSVKALVGHVALVLYRELWPEHIGGFSGTTWFLCFLHANIKEWWTLRVRPVPRVLQPKTEEREWESLAWGQLCHWAWPASTLVVSMQGGLASFSGNFWKNRGISPCVSSLESLPMHSWSPGDMPFQCLLLMVATENADWLDQGCPILSMHRKLRLLEIVHFLIEAERKLF